MALDTSLSQDPGAAVSDAAAEPALVALVGNPNSGKTALFNALTGSRQKVANYAGVTVERKEGVLTTPSGRQMRVLDLPGTYSLRARSPDEVVTRDAVIGKLEGELAPQVLICVADATNLRLVLRLALELKQVGRPFVLALNMYDIAQRQGLRIDLERLSRELGAPIVTTVATRKRGLPELLEKVEGLVAARKVETENVWHEPAAGEIRAAHAEAQRIFKACVKPPERPDTVTGKIDDVLLHPVAGVLILMTLLFVMFQAVFTWATPVMDGIDGAFAAIAGWTSAHLPAGLVTSFISDGLIAGVGSVLVFLPQILILFFFILLLEDSGYMARAAFLMDKIMGGAGLHGRAFIPLLSSFACAIPGIMSTRVIDNKEDRLTTILVAPLMTCSARIPVYTLIIGAFIPKQTRLGRAVAARPGHVRPLCRRHRQRSAGLVRHPSRVLARRGRALHDGAADLSLARAAQRADEPVDPRPDLHEPRRPDHPAADGAGLGPVDLPLSAGRRDGAGHRLQLRRSHR